VPTGGNEMGDAGELISAATAAAGGGDDGAIRSGDVLVRAGGVEGSGR